MGGHQYRLHNGMPAVNQPGGISAIKSSDLDNVPIVPGCTLLLRIMPHTQVRAHFYTPFEIVVRYSTVSI